MGCGQKVDFCGKKGLFISLPVLDHTQLGLMTNSKSRLFCVGDQADFVGIRGLRE